MSDEAKLAFIRAAAQEAYDLGHKEGVAERYVQMARRRIAGPLFAVETPCEPEQTSL